MDQSLNLRRDRIHIHALTAEEAARVFDVIDPGRFDADTGETCGCQLLDVVILF